MNPKRQIFYQKKCLTSIDPQVYRVFHRLWRLFGLWRVDFGTHAEWREPTRVLCAPRRSRRKPPSEGDRRMHECHPEPHHDWVLSYSSTLQGFLGSIVYLCNEKNVNIN